MTLIAQPAYPILPAYRPVKFLLSYISTTAVVIENAVVKIRKGGVSIGPSVIIKSSSNSIPGAGLIEYFFEVDIQKYCQDLLEPFTDLPSIFPTAAIPLSGANSTFFDVFSIEVGYQLINSVTGLLEAAPGVDLSNDFYVYTAALQHQFSTEMNLVPYTGTPYGNNLNRLSNSPNPKKVCTNDNEYISIIQEDSIDVNGILISFYDKDGLLIGFGMAYTNAPIGSAQFTVNVGLNGLSNLVYLVGPFPPISSIASYEIIFGYITVTGGPVYTFNPQTETYIYNVQNDCCEDKTLRLHWMNLLGGPDSYTFKYDKDLVLSTSYDSGEKALTWGIGSANPHVKSDIGKMKLKSEGTTAYNVTSDILTNDKATWLSEILTSPKVYAELDGSFIPVIIEKTSQSISRREGKIRMNITAILANDLIIQRT